MANQCAVRNQTSPDNLPVCPYCQAIAGDTEEVLEGSEASGKLASGVDIIAEVVEWGVDLSGVEDSGVSETSEVNLDGEEAVEAVSSGVDLAGPLSGESSQKAGSSPALDEKSIEDLLMGLEERLAGPSSGRVKGEAALAEEGKPVTAPEEAEAEAAEESEVAIAPPKSKESAKATARKKRQRRYVLVGILLGILVLGGGAAAALEYVLDSKNKDLEAKNVEIAKVREESRKALEEAKAAKDDLVEQQKKAEQETEQYRAKLADSEKTLNALRQAVPGAKSDNPKDIAKAVEAVVKARDQTLKEVAAMAKARGESEQVVDAVATQLRVKREAVANTVKELVAARSALDGRLKEIDAKLKDAKVDAEGPAGVAKLADARNQLEQTLARVRFRGRQVFRLEQVERRLDRSIQVLALLLETTKMAVDKARTPLVTSQNPEQKLDTWIALLQNRDLKDGGYLNVARGDGQVVLADPRASAEAKAKAQYVIGLAHRNRGQFAQARHALDKTVKAAAAAKAGGWAKTAGETLRELSDPAAYYLPRAERLRALGDFRGALAELDAAVQANSQDGRLLALRGLVLLERHPMGKLDPASQKLIRQDAEAARKDPRTAAAGAYVLGRLDEELGNLDGAKKHYRAALEAHKGSPDEASRFIIALARVLHRDRGVVPVAPAALPEPKSPDAKEPKIGQRPMQPTVDAPAQANAADPRLTPDRASTPGISEGARRELERIDRNWPIRVSR